MKFKIVILESIKSSDYETGTVLREVIENLKRKTEKSITIEFYKIEKRDCFSQKLKEIRSKLEANTFLLLHIESHGFIEKNGGIYLCSDEVIYWGEILLLLSDIQNKEQTSDMLLFLGTCHGNNIINSVHVGSPYEIPFKYLVSSNQLVYPRVSLLVNGYREFYKTLFEKEDVSLSYQSLVRIVDTFILNTY